MLIVVLAGPRQPPLDDHPATDTLFARRSISNRVTAKKGLLVALVMLWLVVPAASWITQMQSKYGVQTSNVANVWDGNASSDFNAFNTMGYYWHWPQDADSNRGLGCARVVPRPALHRQVYNHGPPESLHSSARTTICPTTVAASSGLGTTRCARRRTEATSSSQTTLRTSSRRCALSPGGLGRQTPA